nr:bifunctional oligoribonuclease/PAP phosphatase NrnA [Anaerolineae bacterium]
MNQIDDAVKAIKSAQRILLATHVVPDPDAIGSTAALGLVLKEHGKSFVIVCDDPVPSDLRFVPGSDLFERSVPDGFSPDLFIGLDASDRERLGKISMPYLNDSALLTINIDHHITNLNYASINLVDPGAAATSELLIRLIDALGIAVSPDIAIALMAALVGDTRAFSTNSVTSKTLAVAARLVESGADVAEIINSVLYRRTVDQLRLWALALNTLQIEDGVIWTVVSHESRKALGLHQKGVNGISNLLLSAEEAAVSATFFEDHEGRVEISFRSRPGYNVAEVALSLGGGGHALAAGCTIDGPIDAAVGRVIGLLKKVERQPPGVE